MRVWVDAGHGGYDPGAVGPSGLREKDITLAVTKRIASLLEGKGYAVGVTRNKDEYVSLG